MSEDQSFNVTDNQLKKRYRGIFNKIYFEFKTNLN